MQDRKALNIQISSRQMEMLTKISQFSLKSKAVLVREALELLFKTPGGKVIS